MESDRFGKYNSLMFSVHTVQRKKALFFLQDGVGGAERMSVLIGKGLDKALFDVRFYLVDRHSKTSIADFIPQGFAVAYVSNPNPAVLMRNLARVILGEKPDIVFSSVMYISTKFMPFKWLFPKVKVVLRCENYLYTFTRMQQLRIGMTYRMADHIIAQTQEMKDELMVRLHIGEKKIEVLPNPIDKEMIDRETASVASPYPDNGRKHYVAVGRFAYQKGFDILAKAFCSVCRELKDTDLYIIGDSDADGGKIHSEIMAIAKAEQYEDRIHCIGYSPNPYPYIKYADCFVLSSRWEGLPNVLLESLYLHTPVATTMCIPIISRIVEVGVNGYLAETEHPDALADAMKKAIRLGKVASGYEPTSIADFQKLFL